MESIRINEDWLQKSEFADYAKGLFWLGCLMNLAEQIKEYPVWEYQTDPNHAAGSGLNAHDIVVCYNRAVEIIANSKDGELLAEAEEYMKRVHENLCNLPCCPDLEQDRNVSGTEKMLATEYYVNCGRTLRVRAAT